MDVHLCSFEIELSFLNHFLYHNVLNVDNYPQSLCLAGMQRRRRGNKSGSSRRVWSYQAVLDFSLSRFLYAEGNGRIQRENTTSEQAPWFDAWSLSVLRNYWQLWTVSNRQHMCRPRLSGRWESK